MKSFPSESFLHLIFFKFDILFSTTHLSRSTVRVGIGPSARKALLEHAKTKPELAKLVATPTTPAKKD
jgi:hypothetical protein